MKNMDVLTKEQKEYIELKTVMNNMYLATQYEDGNHMCVPSSSNGIPTTHSVEGQFYFFLEMLKGEHNELLQNIISRTET